MRQCQVTPFKTSGSDFWNCAKDDNKLNKKKLIGECRAHTHVCTHARTDGRTGPKHNSSGGSPLIYARTTVLKNYGYAAYATNSKYSKQHLLFIAYSTTNPSAATPANVAAADHQFITT